MIKCEKNIFSPVTPEPKNVCFFNVIEIENVSHKRKTDRYKIKRDKYSVKKPVQFSL
jgi:hypothetical protein